MIYIYDILLNFNENLYEFYEWEKGDNISHIKKIPIFKVNTSFMNDLISNKIVIDTSINKLLFNKTEVFDNKKIRTIKYACLFTDGYKVIGVLLNEDGSIFKISDLLLDEASDVISISNRCNLINIEYNIIESRNNNYYLTRKELRIKKYLSEELTSIYDSKDNLKLEYLYFEYFNKNLNDIDSIYKELVDSLNNINNKHFKLYELIKLCNKSTSNLTN